MLKKLIAALSNARSGGRRIASLFQKLPKEEEAPGYYDVIRQPIAIAEMREKVRGGGYSLSMLDADLELSRLLALIVLLSMSASMS